LAAVALILMAAQPAAVRAGEALVAVATNFLEPARRIAKQFEKDSGHRITLAGGSSGKLAAQILHGAPFDVFLSADQERVGLLVERHAAVADSRFTYARGQLALWSADKLPLTGDHLGSLKLAAGERMAIANARLAPYGLAAEQALKAAGLLDLLRPQLVYGENIGQTFSVVATGNARAGLVALSQVMSLPDAARGNWIGVPDDMHEPIRQDAALTVRGKFKRGGQGIPGLPQGPAGAAHHGGTGIRGGCTMTAEAVSAIWLTLQLGLVSVALLLVVSVPLAWWLAFTCSPWRTPVETLTTLPLVLPPTVLGFYLLILLGPAGWLGKWWVEVTGTTLTFSFAGLVIASMVHTLPFVVQPMKQAFQDMGTGPLEDAATLGAGPVDRVWSVGLPLARRGIVTAAVLGFAHVLGEFGVVLMVGGNIPGQTKVISIAIYESVETLDYTTAHWLSAGLLVVSFLVLFAVFAVNRSMPLRMGR
jgi:molybdate transport system permease protein